MVDAAVFLGEQVLDFPIALFGADAEFKVFFRDGVPVLTRCSRS